jgi:hypothetical protein
MGVDGQCHGRAALAPGKRPVPIVKGGLQGRFGRARKISPAPGFDPRTVQPVASGYTERAIPTHITELPAQNYPGLSTQIFA